MRHTRESPGAARHLHWGPLGAVVALAARRGVGHGGAAVAVAASGAVAGGQGQAGCGAVLTTRARDRGNTAQEAV